jgi:hypothetical protein
MIAPPLMFNVAAVIILALSDAAKIASSATSS